jgi:hypothetical protein
MGMGLFPGYRTGSSLNYGAVLPNEYAVGIHPYFRQRFQRLRWVAWLSTIGVCKFSICQAFGMGQTGKALRQVLATYGISQNQVGVKMGIGRSNVYRWVNRPYWK